MTGSTATGQIELERNGERENERERERQVLPGTIQLPSELYWIPPPFKIKRQISLDSPGSERKNHIIFPRQPRSLYPLPTPFQRVLYITLSTVDFYYLSYAFLNT